MTDFSGKFFWYELMTSDPKAALAFYGDVVGWTAQPFGPDGDYNVVSGSAGPLGGVMAIPAEAKECGMTPWWGGYVGSADVDADATRLTDAGGSVKRPPEDIPGVGRFAVMADPGGAVFMLLKGSSPEGMDAPPLTALGHVGWHELYAGDFDKDLAFYTGQFGWSKGEAMDMGAMGSYQLVSQTGSTDFDGMTGGIMPRPEPVPVPLWLFYFTVGDIDAAVARVTAGGGSVMQGPMEVPGGAWIIQAADPQGAMFALVGSKGEGVMDKISPCLWFDGQAEEAAHYYASLFGGSVDHVSYYPEENPSPSPLPGGSVLLVEFSLFGQSYQALNGGPQFSFDEAISLSVACADQAELDGYFDRLTGDGGKAGPCGWVTDKYGLSWQLVTRQIMDNYHTGDRAGIARMMQVMMTMQKLDTAAMHAAFKGEAA